MYRTPLKIATKKRKSKKISSEAAKGEASEPKPKKAKKKELLFKSIKLVLLCQPYKKKLKTQSQ
jgi:hypothetical protein